MIFELLTFWAAVSAPVTTVDAKLFEVDPDRPEYCRKTDGSEVDLLAVAFLKNKKLDLRPYGVGAVLSIERDWVEIRSTTGSSVRSYKQDMGYAAVRGESLDVDLTIALYQGRPFLHWKETFKHKAARLGLLSIHSDGKLEHFCTGWPSVIPLH